MLDADLTTEAERESPFAFDELFFSRTTESGIILSGNGVFQRVSGYTWDELINKPHKIIRHPDMPKAVFWLLWDTIKKGRPIGAFVKNRAKDGRYYWVFAIVTPIENGFLSVRVKPKGALFQAAEKEYRALRSKELSEKLSSEDSAGLLLARLRELGFREYASFMSAAMCEVLMERNQQIGREEDRSISLFKKLMALAKSLLEKAEDIYRIYEGNEYVSLNMRIHSAQLGDEGAPLCVISNNYTSASKEIQGTMKRFMEGGEQVAQAINEGLFLVGTSKIQREVYDAFTRENDGEETNGEQASNELEMKYLDQQRQAYAVKAADGLKAIAKQVTQFQDACQEMRQLVLGLEVTRIMGKIESASLSAAQVSLNNLIDDLGIFQRDILDGLKDINLASRSINRTIELLLNEAV
jgi:aerotaxis receptor